MEAATDADRQNSCIARRVGTAAGQETSRGTTGPAPPLRDAQCKMTRFRLSDWVGFDCRPSNACANVRYCAIYPLCAGVDADKCWYCSNAGRRTVHCKSTLSPPCCSPSSVTGPFTQKIIPYPGDDVPSFLQPPAWNLMRRPTFGLAPRPHKPYLVANRVRDAAEVVTPFLHAGLQVHHGYLFGVVRKEQP